MLQSSATMSTIGFIAMWASIIGVLLALPLSILAGLLTPKVERWWATTSDRRRDKRMARLKADLEDIPRFRSAVSRQENFLWGMRFLALGLWSMTTFLFMLFSEVLVIHAHLDDVKSIFPRLNVSISIVALYRLEFIKLSAQHRYPIQL